MQHLDNKLPLSFRYEEIQVSLRYNEKSRFKAAKVCYKGLLRTIVSLALLIITGLALPIKHDLNSVKFCAYNLVRSLELTSGGLLYLFSKEKGAYLIMDASAHIAMYDRVVRNNRRS